MIGHNGLEEGLKTKKALVVADDTEAMIAELNTAMDQLDETMFGCGIETVAVNHQRTRKWSGLAHTLAAGESLAAAFRCDHLMRTLTDKAAEPRTTKGIVPKPHPFIARGRQCKST
jgi:hypothetical protein